MSRSTSRTLLLVGGFAILSLLTPMRRAHAQTWTTYDASQGTLPQAQGFTLGESGPASPSPTIVGGILNQGLTSYNGLQFWQKFDVPFNFDKGFILEANLKVLSSTYVSNSPNGGAPNSQRSGYYLDAIDALGRQFSLGIASGGITLNTDEYDVATNGIPFTAFNTTDAFHQYRLVVVNGLGSVYIDNTFFGSTPLGSVLYSTALADRASFGDGTQEGASQTQLGLFRYAAVPEPGTIVLLLAGGLTGAGLFLRRRRANQIV